MGKRLLVRAAVAADAAVLTHNNLAMAAETEAKALDAAIVGRGVRAVFCDARCGRYVVATDDDGPIVGQLMLTAEWSDWRNAWWWWIQSVYVAPSWRRQGVYRALHDHVWAEACRAPREGADGVCGVRLYVEAENTTAQTTYAALGMGGSYRVMELPRPP